MPNCRTCAQSFTIEADDQAVYASFAVPVPLDCPRCRQQHRLCWRNERFIHRRTCDKCQADILAALPAQTRYPVYCVDCWYGDSWDARDYGREFDFSRPFFVQFAELQAQIPRPNLFITRGTVENSDFASSVSYVKNCYLIFGSQYCEDSYYSRFIKKSAFLCDCTEVYSSERCYDCVNCDQCYGLVASDDCKNCRDSAFLFDCSGCHDCFGCTNLRNSAYCLWNKQLTEEEYHTARAAIDLQSRAVYATTREQYRDLVRTAAVHQYRHGFQNVDSTGDYLLRTKNARHAFDCLDVEDCTYVTQINGAKDCYDVDHFGIIGLERAYYSVNVGLNVRDVLFSNQIWNGCARLTYCDNCLSGTEDCFGCVGLVKQKFCILNKQYDEATYRTLVAQIIDHLKHTGEYGEFFPAALSYTPYNESFAHDYYPLTREQALAGGFLWADDSVVAAPADAVAVPDRVTDPAAMVQQTFRCPTCGRGFKLIDQELRFYADLQLPPPAECFDCRMVARLHRKNPRQLWHRQCLCQTATHGHSGQCPTEFETTYAPDRPEKVYCEECYQKEIY